MHYPEVRKEVVSFIYQIWNIYRIQSAGRGGPGWANCGWKNRKVTSWMDVNESIWWRAACCSAHIFVLNYIPRLSGSHVWVSWTRVTTHMQTIHISPLLSAGLCQTMRVNTSPACLHIHTSACGYLKKLQMFWLSQFDWNIVFFLQTQSLTSHVCFVRESWLLPRWINTVHLEEKKKKQQQKMSHPMSTWELLKLWQRLSFGAED